MTLPLKYRGGSENEVSGSAQPWDSTNVWGDVVGREHGGNDAEYWEGGEVPRNVLDITECIGYVADDCRRWRLQLSAAECHERGAVPLINRETCWKSA